MSYKFSSRPLSTNLPICRWQLYEDLVCDAKSGPVERVWLSPGHVFITFNGGSHMYTFDTKPTNKTHEEKRGCLDLIDLDHPVLDVLVSSTNYSIVHVVLRNGHIQCWKFRSDLTWMLVKRFDLCSVNRSEVTSICLHSSQETLYWCERRPDITDVANYSIYKRHINIDEEKLRDHTVTQLILHNCPSASLYPVPFGVAIVIKLKPPLVSMVISWLPVANKVMINVGPHQVELPELGTRQPIDFRSLAFKVIGYTVQLKPEHRMTNVTYDPQTMEVSVIEDLTNIRTISDSKKCQLKSFQKLKDVKETERATNWIKFGGFLAAVFRSHIMLFDHDTGHLVDSLSSPDKSDIVDVCQLSTGVMWMSFFTTSNIYIIQRTKEDKEVKIKDMLNSSHFQTQAVELGYLESLKTNNSSLPVYDSITKLGKAWETESSHPPNTKLAETLNPYLKEYWSLEKFQQEILNGTLVLPSVCPGDIEEEVLRVLSPETSMSMSGRQAWLLLLADKFPHEVLSVLMEQLDFDTEDISSAQLHRWQCILAKDSVVSPVSSKVAVPMFEHICRLLFIVQPSRLVNFVKIAQLINDQRVGVSAFIRRRQALQYYDRAIACLPTLSKSQCVKEATTVYVQLLLASEEDGCEIKAVQTYMEQECWREAIDLLPLYADNPSLHVKLFHTILLCMTQKNMLAIHADALFNNMPNCKSMDSVTSAFPLHSNNPNTGSLKQVFATDPKSVQIAQIRPHLLGNIKPHLLDKMLDATND
ncbi:BLOC-2 complex member HPS6-like isoform X2 [Argopecten irradians]|uniref:BLOC-2 complex member HPS6-like isoform X2 n=1 Tax=Argopecten irradians TaxID=31199 RepID=UPI00371D5B90